MTETILSFEKRKFVSKFSWKLENVAEVHRILEEYFKPIQLSITRGNMKQMNLFKICIKSVLENYSRPSVL